MSYKTQRQIKALKGKKAMPDVKKVVDKHGLVTVNYCLNQLKEYNRKSNKLAKMKKEAAELEKQISNN